MAASVTPITIRGRYFWKGDERFIINGVVYQPQRASKDTLLIPDPLTDDGLEELEKCIPLFKELGLNTLFVYYIDPSRSHDDAMNMLAEAGIYVLACLETPRYRISRTAPFDAYRPDLLRAFFRTVDVLAGYANTLGVFVTNETVNSAQALGAGAAAVVRAAARDVRKYAALIAAASEDALGRRVLPVGVNSADVSILQRSQFDYYTAALSEDEGGDADGAIDFYAFNSFRWAGPSNMRMSGYDNLVKTFRDTHIPTFISEYGTNVRSPRPFDETRAILSRDMTDTFSGGVVYEFFEGLSQYGIVDRGEDGDLVRRPDFMNFASSVRACSDVRHNTSLAETPEGQAIVMRRPEFPQKSYCSWWKPQPKVPDCPLDWDEIREQIEDRQWVDVEQEIRELEVEDLASSMWDRFRIDGTGPRWH